MNPLLSILVSYRNRPQHLHNFLHWFQTLDLESIEAIIIEQDVQSTVRHLVEVVPGCKYEFFQNGGVFRLSQSLNLGLSLSKAKIIAPFDIDLVPWQKSLQRQLKFALQNPNILISGYRLMTCFQEITPENIHEAFRAAEVSASEHPAFLMKRFLGAEKYGVVPMLLRQRLNEIGGWDERYIGWGAEDQELLERYISTDIMSVRSEELIYLHQHHGFEANWRETEFIRKNRQMFNSERKTLTDNS